MCCVLYSFASPFHTKLFHYSTDSAHFYRFNFAFVMNENNSLRLFIVVVALLLLLVLFGAHNVCDARAYTSSSGSTSFGVNYDCD